MSDEYEQVARGKLKLKSDSSKVSKKKKKDKKNREKLEREHENHQHKDKSNGTPSAAAPGRTMTKAELSFKKMQEKMVCVFKKNQNFAHFVASMQICLVIIVSIAFICFSFLFSFSKRKESWKKHHKRINNVSRNSTNI